MSGLGSRYPSRENERPVTFFQVHLKKQQGIKGATEKCFHRLNDKEQSGT